MKNKLTKTPQKIGRPAGAASVRAESPLVRQSPRKIRYLVKAIKKIADPEAAILQLSFVPRRAAQALQKTIRQAIANATNNLNLSPQSLQIDTIAVNSGPTIKRSRFGGRGRVKPILKRTSRITVILKTKGGKTE